MHPQRLDIGGHQPQWLARGLHLAETRHVIAGKNPLVGERVGRGGAAIFADGVEQHDPVLGHQIAAGFKEFGVMRGADMFEHPDRHDPVEAPLDRAIVHQFEADLVRHPRILRAAAGDR